MTDFGRYSRTHGRTRTVVLQGNEIPYEWIGKENKFKLDYTQMYDAPPMSYKFMRELVEHFGTEEIDTEDVHRSGCEIYVFNPTKNIPPR